MSYSDKEAYKNSNVHARFIDNWNETGNGMEERLEKLEEQIAVIRDRNRRVEADKAWETSSFRIAAIAGMTYVVAFSFMWSVGNVRPWLNALIPAIGFVLSTQSLPFVKRSWLKRNKMI